MGGGEGFTICDPEVFERMIPDLKFCMTVIEDYVIMDIEYSKIIVIRKFPIGQGTLFQAATDYCIRHTAISAVQLHTNAGLCLRCCRCSRSLQNCHVPHSLGLLR
jgi:hypothetical protein